MGKTYKTDKEVVQARRAAANNEIGPEIILRKPYPGDIHPLNKHFISNILKRVPIQYLKGLNRIELRARNAEIGQPFGFYSPKEKSIVLYSLPTIWRLDWISYKLEESLLKFYTEVKWGEESVTIEFKNNSVFGLWFYSYVFAHELGHHFREEYKKKRSLKSYDAEELLAELHAKRLTDYIISN